MFISNEFGFNETSYSVTIRLDFDSVKSKFNIMQQMRGIANNSVSLSVRLFVPQSMRLSVRPSVHPPVRLSIHPSLRLSVRPSVTLKTN